MNDSIVTALAALGGSLVGGMTTFASTWLNHRYQDARERKSNELNKREALYGAFITEAIRVALEALEREIDTLGAVAQLYALLNRIRLTASTEVLTSAERVVDTISAFYVSENKTPRQVYEDMQKDGKRIQDPLRQFGEACRRELQEWR